ISVTVTVNKDYVYGDYLSPRDIEVHLDFGDDDDSLIADVELAPLWIGGPDLDLTWDELWSLGRVQLRSLGPYWVGLADLNAPALVGKDAANFELTTVV